MTPTPTSGAADLRTAAQAVVDRWDTPLWKDVPATAEYIGRLRAALAAGQATAAQQGVAYAALPDEGEPWRGHKFKEVQRGCWRCDCGKTIKEVTSDQSTPASGGNYPVMPKRYTVDDDGEELFTADKMRAFADATHTLRASHGQAPAETGNSVSAQTDSVLEDAARYRWLAANCRSTSEHWGGRWSIIIDGPAPKSHNSEDDFDAAVDKARKQGEKQ